MTYMQSNHVFTVGIQELSFDEISFVGGGNIESDIDVIESPWDDAMLGGQRDRNVLTTGALYVGIGILAIAAAPVIAAGAAAAAACNAASCSARRALSASDSVASCSQTLRSSLKDESWVLVEASSWLTCACCAWNAATSCCSLASSACSSALSSTGACGGTNGPDL